MLLLETLDRLTGMATAGKVVHVYVDDVERQFLFNGQGDWSEIRPTPERPEEFEDAKAMINYVMAVASSSTHMAICDSPTTCRVIPRRRSPYLATREPIATLGAPERCIRRWKDTIAGCTTLDQSAFRIWLLTHFRRCASLDALLEATAEMMTSAEAKLSDDGIGQEVLVKANAAKLVRRTISPELTLRVPHPIDGANDVSVDYLLNVSRKNQTDVTTPPTLSLLPRLSNVDADGTMELRDFLSELMGLSWFEN